MSRSKFVFFPFGLWLIVSSFNPSKKHCVILITIITSFIVMEKYYIWNPPSELYWLHILYLYMFLPFSADLKYHAASPRTPAPCNTPSCACRAMGSTPNGKKWIDCLSPKVWHGRWCQSIFEISYCFFVEIDPFGHFGPKMFWSCVTPKIAKFREYGCRNTYSMCVCVPR